MCANVLFYQIDDETMINLAHVVRISCAEGKVNYLSLELIAGENTKSIWIEDEDKSKFKRLSQALKERWSVQ